MSIIYPASNNASGEVRIGDRKEGNAWQKFTDLEITSNPEGPDYLTVSYKINNNEIKKHNVYFMDNYQIGVQENHTIEYNRTRAAYIPSMATSMARPNRFNIKFVNPDRKQSEYIYYSFSIDDQKKYEEIVEALGKGEKNIRDFKRDADLKRRDADLKRRYENYKKSENKGDDYTLKMFTDMVKEQEAKEREKFLREKGYYGGGSTKRTKKRKHKNSRSLKRKSKTSKRKRSKKRHTRKVKKTKRARRKSTKKR
jgi:hypothetical protein